MSEAHPSPFPTALVLDTSFPRTLGGTDSGPYQTFVEYITAEDQELYLSRGVVEELTEQHGYSTRAGEVMDRVRERLAAFE